MRTHKAQHFLDKERDYLVIEAAAFFSDFTHFLLFLQEVGSWPEDAQVVLQELIHTSKDHDLRPLRALAERAGQIAWKYLHTPYHRQTSALLMLVRMVDEFFYAWSKEPSNYTQDRRPQGATP